MVCLCCSLNTAASGYAFSKNTLLSQSCSLYLILMPRYTDMSILIAKTYTTKAIYKKVFIDKKRDELDPSKKKSEKARDFRGRGA